MLQKTVGLYPAIGVEGGKAGVNQSVYTAENYVSDGTCQAGKFAFEVTSTGAVNPFTVKSASLKGKAKAKVLGLVERTFTGVVTNEDVGTYWKGENLTIAIRGDYYIKAPAAATIGQAVLCDPTTGNITFGAAGAENDTGWVVKSAGEEGDIILISNYGIDVVATAAAA